MSSLEDRANSVSRLWDALSRGANPIEEHDSPVEPELEESLRRLHAMTQAPLPQKVVAPRYAETAGPSTSVSRRKSDMTAALSNGSVSSRRPGIYPVNFPWKLKYLRGRGFVPGR